MEMERHGDVVISDQYASGRVNTVKRKFNWSLRLDNYIPSPLPISSNPNRVIRYVFGIDYLTYHLFSVVLLSHTYPSQPLSSLPCLLPSNIPSKCGVSSDHLAAIHLSRQRVLVTGGAGYIGEYSLFR